MMRMMYHEVDFHFIGFGPDSYVEGAQVPL
jgi:hypothetical protein